MHGETERNDTLDPTAPENETGHRRSAAESESDAKDKLPAAPSQDDDSELGDTDQHSDA